MSVLRALPRLRSSSIHPPVATRLAKLPRRGYADHGGAHYNEPSGHLFGEKPPPPGQKRVKEDWENIYYWGMFGSMAVAGIGLYFKPDTSIQTWALNEARNRLEARGVDYKYTPTGTTAEAASSH